MEKQLFSICVVFLCINNVLSARESCPGGQIWNDFGSPCDKTCADKERECADEPCVPRCECREGEVLRNRNSRRCIPVEECDVCPRGQIWDDCVSPCPSTCADPDPVCILPCEEGCKCPDGEVLNRRQCVLPEECPERRRCRQGKVWNEEASPCPATCANRYPECPGEETSPGCECRPGTILNNRDRCVDPNSCRNEATLSSEAKWLKERISCSICLEIFDKPHTLPCLHSLCKACIDGLKPTRHEDTDGYKCPVCNEFYEKKNVRHNFLISELLEFYQMITTKNASTVCKQCGNEKPTHRCIECKADLCGPCKGFHDKFELMKTHRSVSLEAIEKGILIDRHVFCEQHPDELIKLNCVLCEVSVCAVCKLTTHDGHKCESTADALKRMLPAIKQMQATIKEHVKDIKTQDACISKDAQTLYKQIKSMEDEVKDAHAEIQEKLNNDRDVLLGELKTMRQKVEEQEKMYKGRIAQCETEYNHVIEWVDTVTDTAQGVSLLQELQSGIRKKLGSVAQKMEENRKRLAATTKLDDNVLALQIQRQRMQNKNAIGKIGKRSSRVWPFSLQSLCRNKPKHISTVQFKHAGAQRCGVVKNQLWITPWVKHVNALIWIYSTDGRYIKTLTFEDKIKHIRAVVEWQVLSGYDSSLTVAMVASDSGLFAVSKNGKITDTLHKASFSDVCVVVDNVYALNCDGSQIVVSRKANGEFENIKTIELKTCTPSRYNTLQIVKNFIYVYQYESAEAALQYNMKGELLAKYGEQKCAKDSVAGQLHGGSLCGLDSAGSLLICDYGNQRLQVLTADGQWVITSLSNLDVEPRYAAPLRNGLFCIMSNDKLYIYRLT